MIKKTDAVQAIWNEIKTNSGLRDWINKLDSDTRVTVRMVERDSDHFTVRKGAGTQRIPSMGGFGYVSNRIDIVVNYNLANAKQDAKNLGMSLSLAQLIAHELGHAYYIAYIDNDAKPGDPMSNYMSRTWENELRMKGRARSYHDAKH